jgi:CBS domain-containing protein
VLCPVCESENLPGSDICEHCGADLTGVGVPEPTSSFQRTLVAERLSQLGHRVPISVTPRAPVLEAIRSMQDHRIGCVLVSDGQRLVGIFTERDALLKVAGRPAEGIRVEDVMTADPVVLREDDSVAVAIHKMAVGGFRHIPLVEDGHAIGIVSARDVLHDLVGLLA